MKKIASFIVLLASLMSLPTVCFAGPKKATAIDANVIQEIADQIAHNNGLSPDCINSSNGDAKKLITVKAVNLGSGKSKVEGFQVQATSQACCGGEASCPTWIFRSDGGNLTKIFGPEASTNIKFLNDKNATNGLRAMIVVYVGGSHAVRSEDFYVFDGTKYEGISMSKRKK